jgi:hypothetical protein
VALDDAVHLFESFEDSRAAAELTSLLRHSLPGEIAAKAHLYLGLIALNASKPDEVKAEFRHALEANPGIELPRDASPKARLAFGEVRHALMAEFEAGGARANEPFTAAPAASAETQRARTSHSHAVAYILGAATVVFAGVAVYGGIQLLNYNSMVSSGNSSVGSGAKPPYSLDQLNSARGPASFWAVGWPVSAALGAAGVAGTILTW